MPSTTKTLAATTVSLADVVTAMSERCPSMTATPGEVAAWFEHGVAMLRRITSDRAHPEHDKACALAARYSADARAARMSGATL